MYLCRFYCVMNSGRVPALVISAGIGYWASKAHWENGLPTTTSSHVCKWGLGVPGGHRFVQAMHFHGAAHGVSKVFAYFHLWNCVGGEFCGRDSWVETGISTAKTNISKGTFARSFKNECCTAQEKNHYTSHAWSPRTAHTIRTHAKSLRDGLLGFYTLSGKSSSITNRIFLAAAAAAAMIQHKPKHHTA